MQDFEIIQFWSGLHIGITCEAETGKEGIAHSKPHNWLPHHKLPVEFIHIIHRLPICLSAGNN